MHDPPPIPDNRQLPDTQPVIVQLSDIAPKPVRWLWPQRIPLGKLTLLVGDPAVGKSLLAADIAARVSAGIPWPDSPDEPNQPAGVVLLCTEDDLADTVRPRLDAANADHQRIAAITSVKRTVLSPLPKPLRAISLLPGLPHLETAIQNSPQCRLVIIDPILPSLNLGAPPPPNDTRAVIEPLADLAARHQVAVLAVHRAARNTKGFILERLTAKLAPGAARTVWALVHDADAPQRRLFVPVRSTLADNVQPLPCYVTLSQQHHAPAIDWVDEPVGISSQAALERSAANDHQIAAREWLRQKLDKGPVKAESVLDDARYEGFTHQTVRKAFTQIRAQRARSGFGPDGFWVWAPPLSQIENKAQNQTDSPS